MFPLSNKFAAVDSKFSSVQQIDNKVQIIFTFGTFEASVMICVVSLRLEK